MSGCRFLLSAGRRVAPRLGRFDRAYRRRGESGDPVTPAVGTVVFAEARIDVLATLIHRAAINRSYHLDLVVAEAERIGVRVGIAGGTGEHAGVEGALARVLSA